jgi:hypothetical protein
MLEAVGDTMLGRVVTARAVVRLCGIFWRCGPAGCGGWALPVGFCGVAGTVLDMPFADVLGVELLHREAARPHPERRCVFAELLGFRRHLGPALT